MGIEVEGSHNLIIYGSTSSNFSGYFSIFLGRGGEEGNTFYH